MTTKSDIDRMTEDDTYLLALMAAIIAASGRVTTVDAPKVAMNILRLVKERDMLPGATNRR